MVFFAAPRLENESFCSEVPPELDPKKSFLNDSTCVLFAVLIAPPSDKDDLSAGVALLVGVSTPGFVESPVAMTTGFPPLASLYRITSDLKTGLLFGPTTSVTLVAVYICCLFAEEVPKLTGLGLLVKLAIRQPPHKRKTLKSVVLFP